MRAEAHKSAPSLSDRVERRARLGCALWARMLSGLEHVGHPTSTPPPSFAIQAAFCWSLQCAHCNEHLLLHASLWPKPGSEVQTEIRCMWIRGLFLPIKGKSGLAGNDQLLNSIYLFREGKRDREKRGAEHFFWDRPFDSVGVFLSLTRSSGTACMYYTLWVLGIEHRPSVCP